MTYTGEVLKKQQAVGDSIQIDLTPYPQGAYVIMLSTQGRVVVGKVVKM